MSGSTNGPSLLYNNRKWFYTLMPRSQWQQSEWGAEGALTPSDMYQHLLQDRDETLSWGRKEMYSLQGVMALPQGLLPR